jgi:hypothetical protein
MNERGCVVSENESQVPGQRGQPACRVAQRAQRAVGLGVTERLAGKQARPVDLAGQQSGNLEKFRS